MPKRTSFYTAQDGAVVSGTWNDPTVIFNRSSVVTESGVTCETVGTESWTLRAKGGVVARAYLARS